MNDWPSLVSVRTNHQFVLWPCPSYTPLLDTGAQPLISEDGKIILAVNGEIYNHIALRESVGPDVKFKTHSDCEVIIPLVRIRSVSACLPSL